MSDRTYNVLFLCTGNSARSIIAEALLNHLGQGRFKAHSAGSHPTGKVNPFALELLQRAHLPIHDLRSKSWEGFAQARAPAMDFIVTVCDNAAAEACPIWPGRPVSAHWGVPDPAAVEGSDNEKRAAFRDAAAILRRRVEMLASLPIDELDEAAMTRELRRIGEK